MIFRPLLHGTGSTAESIFSAINLVLLAMSFLALWLYRPQPEHDDDDDGYLPGVDSDPKAGERAT